MVPIARTKDIRLLATGVEIREEGALWRSDDTVLRFAFDPQEPRRTTQQ
jgi:hypothetical protein